MVDPDIGRFFYSVSLRSLCPRLIYLRTARASPLSARTFFTPRFRIITFLASLTMLYRLSMKLPGQGVQETYIPNPSNAALESFPMILVLLPTLT